MAVPEFNPAILDTESLIHADDAYRDAVREGHRPTVIGGILIANELEVVLVHPRKSEEAGDTLYQGLIYPQGGMREGETPAETYMRDIIREELGIDPSLLLGIYGLEAPNLQSGGQARGGHRQKGYIPLCGVVADRPRLVLNRENADSRMVSLGETGMLFFGQKPNRRQRNTAMTNAIIRLIATRRVVTL